MFQASQGITVGKYRFRTGTVENDEFLPRLLEKPHFVDSFQKLPGRFSDVEVEGW